MRSALAAILITGCTTQVDTAEQAIRGGDVDDADPAVVALSIGDYQFCSGVLVAPHTVLTAGHCDLLDMTASFGTDVSSPAQAIAVVEAFEHPSYTGEGQPYDFALMKLAVNPGIDPVALNTTALDDSELGQAMRHVGFGVTDDSTKDGGGIKRTVTYPLNRIEPQLIYSGADGKQTCSGDSGAPAFMTIGGSEVVVGIVSDGPDCQLSQDGWDGRVDAVTDWIDTTISTIEATPPSPSHGCSAGGGGSPAVALAFLGVVRRRRGSARPTR